MLNLLLFAMIGAPSATAAETPVLPTSPIVIVNAPPTPSGERLICRREQIIGSNQTKKICTTRAEMSAQQRAAREEVERMTSTVNAASSN